MCLDRLTFVRSFFVVHLVFVPILLLRLVYAVMAWRVRTPRCLDESLVADTAVLFWTTSSPSVRIISTWHGHDM